MRCLQEEKEELAKATVQVTSTKWGRVLRRMNGKPATFTAGQKVVHDFDDSKGTFDVTLSLDKRLEKEMSVLKHACFFMMLKLGKERQPMELGLKLKVTYRTKFGSRKTLEERLVIYTLAVFERLLIITFFHPFQHSCEIFWKNI